MYHHKIEKVYALHCIDDKNSSSTLLALMKRIINLLSSPGPLQEGSREEKVVRVGEDICKGIFAPVGI